jgi:hypothetical protein
VLTEEEGEEWISLFLIYSYVRTMLCCIKVKVESLWRNFLQLEPIKIYNTELHQKLIFVLIKSSRAVSPGRFYYIVPP